MTAVFVDAAVLWPAQPGAARPAPAALAANERRRAPDTVLVALAVAEAAVAEAGADGTSLASVFTSAYGDLGIVDALCRTLAAEPLLLSPTRFHHSVHNAASGYWAMAAGCQAPSTALAGHQASFAAGWLEAVAQCTADQRPVLLVGCDGEARGPLASVNTSRALLGVALVLQPQPGPRTRWRIETSLVAGTPPRPAARRTDLAANAMADALPLLEALQAGTDTPLLLTLGKDCSLHLRLQAWAAPQGGAAPA